MVLGFKMMNDGKTSVRIEVIGTSVFYITGNSREFMSNLDMTRDEITYLYEELLTLFGLDDNTAFTMQNLSLLKNNDVYELRIDGRHNYVYHESEEIKFYRR